jgi:Protein of unknown function (DUF1194)
MNSRFGRDCLVAFVLALPALSLAAPSAAQTTETTDVDLVLVLAVDASASVTPARWKLERQGYAQAFQNPEVLKAIESGPIGAVAVTLVEWSGPSNESQVVLWEVISDAASADRFSAALAELPRVFGDRTSISNGLLFSAQLFDQAPFQAPRKVIDVSGDGPDNTSGRNDRGTQADITQLRSVRDQVVAKGITINGLPIFGDPRVRNLDGYYQQNVIGGPNSFMIVAQSFETFAMAIERKLLLEIADTGSARHGASIAAAEG